MKDWKCSCGSCKKTTSSWLWCDVGRRIVWFEVPRAASTAIRYDAIGLAADKRCTFESVNYGGRLEFDYSEYFTFGVTRNPWDRLTSAYILFTKGPTHRTKEVCSIFKSHDKTFERFASCVCDGLFVNCHIASVVHYLPSDLDFLIRFETFDEDWARLITTIDTFPCSLRLLKQSGEPKIKSHYTTFYNDNTELIEMVGEFYKEDVERYNYSYDMETA